MSNLASLATLPPAILPARSDPCTSGESSLVSCHNSVSDTDDDFNFDSNRSLTYRQLGHAPYAAVVAERCTWTGGLDALRSDDTVIASDGSYDGLGTGGWGLVVCTSSRVDCFSGRVDAGVGTNSSYRSETYGLLTGLRVAHARPLSGNIKHVTDNLAVARVYQDCENRGSLLTCSQDVWDEIIWYKKALGGRYEVVWRRGHAEDRGPLTHIEDRANHLADGLADAGYDAAVDIRHYFNHSRRWHIRMGGIRHFDDIRSSARLHIGTLRLRSYLDSHNDPRTLNVAMLNAFCSGKSTKSSWGRAETTKFVHLQLATTIRLRRWGYNVPVVTCRACNSISEETLQHILISCRAPKCVDIRRKWFNALLAYPTSDDLSDFLHRRLKMTPDGRLLYQYGKHVYAVDAFGLVTGFLPSDMCVFLRQAARTDDTCGRRFLTYLRRSCSRGLWWPLWKVVTNANANNNPGTVSEDVVLQQDGVADHTGYASDDSPILDSDYST